MAEQLRPGDRDSREATPALRQGFKTNCDGVTTLSGRTTLSFSDEKCTAVQATLITAPEHAAPTARTHIVFCPEADCKVKSALFVCCRAIRNDIGTRNLCCYFSDPTGSIDKD